LFHGKGGFEAGPCDSIDGVDGPSGT
jgi:hypothetical protein